MRHRSNKRFWLQGAFLLLCTVVLWGQTEVEEQAQHPEEGDVNATFRNPDLDVARWVDRFEAEDRDVAANRQPIFDELNLKAGMDIADIGAGTGLFLGLFDRAVGKGGTVYAVEIAPRFIDFLNERIKRESWQSVVPVLSDERSCRLKPNSVDILFICDTYHHFEYPKAMLASMMKALRSGGRLVLVELDPEKGAWLKKHVRGDKATFSREIEAVGFRFEREITMPTLKENYMIVFKRP